MSFDRYCQLIADLCQSVGIPDADEVLTRGELRVGALTVQIPFFDNDPEAIYLAYNFGAVSAGRTYRIFRMMLEANFVVYAMDQAQLGLDSTSEAVMLIVRCPMDPDINGEWLADTLAHYADHGIYWRDNIMSSPDEILESLLDGKYSWIKV